MKIWTRESLLKFMAASPAADPVSLVVVAELNRTELRASNAETLLMEKMVVNNEMGLALSHILAQPSTGDINGMLYFRDNDWSRGGIIKGLKALASYRKQSPAKNLTLDSNRTRGGYGCVPQETNAVGSSPAESTNLEAKSEKDEETTARKGEYDLDRGHSSMPPSEGENPSVSTPLTTTAISDSQEQGRESGPVVSDLTSSKTALTDLSEPVLRESTPHRGAAKARMTQATGTGGQFTSSVSNETILADKQESSVIEYRHDYTSEKRELPLSNLNHQHETNYLHLLAEGQD